MNGLAICAGVAGLELGLSLALLALRTVCFVERDAYAAATLVARMEDEALDPAPIWDDLLTFDGGAWRGLVDIVSAGFPCQPWSCAGKREGKADDRWIWPGIARIIREVRPRLVFLENVPGLVSGGGLEPVLGDLAALGFDAEWQTLRASEVGAPHRRERVFILAYRDEPGPEGERIGGLLDGERSALGDDADGCGEGVGNPGRERLEERRPRPEPGALPPTWPPGPDGDWSGIPEWLWPVVGVAAGDRREGWATAGFEREAATRTGHQGDRETPPQPELHRLAHGLASGLEFRADRLRCGGNGVVALQAAAAFALLARRMMSREDQGGAQ